MRYKRHELLQNISNKGQEILSKSRVAIVGMGALGSNVSELLARSGVNLILIDDDKVSLDNLQRQKLYDEKGIGKYKVKIAKKKLKQINSSIKIDVINKKLDFSNCSYIKEVDLILDCTDNMNARFLINDFCVKNKKKWIYGSVIRSVGYVARFIPDNACFRCIFDKNVIDNSCDEGVLNMAVNIVASIQAIETIKILLNEYKVPELIFIDAWDYRINKIKILRNKKCACCVKKQFDFLDNNFFIVSSCTSSGDYKIKPKLNKNINFDVINKKLKVIKKIENFIIVRKIREVTIYKNGELLVKGAKNRDEANKIAEMIYKL